MSAYPLREILIGDAGKDLPTCLCLINLMSVANVRHSSINRDIRGETSPLDVNETLVIGTANGTMVFLDTFQGMHY